MRRTPVLKLLPALPSSGTLTSKYCEAAGGFSLSFQLSLKPHLISNTQKNPVGENQHVAVWLKHLLIPIRYFHPAQLLKAMLVSLSLNRTHQLWQAQFLVHA